jgi:hypothetical protein
MTPLHVAAFFGCSAVIEVLVKVGRADMHVRCGEFEGGTALHLATFGSCALAQAEAH